MLKSIVNLCSKCKSAYYSLFIIVFLWTGCYMYLSVTWSTKTMVISESSIDRW